MSNKKATVPPLTTVPKTMTIISTATTTVTHTMTVTYRLMSTVTPHGENGVTESANCTGSPSLIALALFLAMFVVLLVIVTAGWVWTIVWTLKKKELGEEADLEHIARDITTSCCLRLKENPAYVGGHPTQSPPNSPKRLKVTLDCNPAYEGSTFTLNKDTDAPDPTYEPIQYSSERQRLESKAHEYETPDTMSSATCGNTAAPVGEKPGPRERSKSQTEDLERTYAVIQS